MDNWQIVLLHTKKTTLLKRAFEAAFPDRVVSLFVPELNRGRYLEDLRPEDMVDFFHRRVYDPGIWKSRVLTIYGDGDFHHYTYALTQMAEREGPWTYFHFDQHRDDWGERDANGYTPVVNCANFVDSIAQRQGAIPFFVGPDVMPKKDLRGYRGPNGRIPIYHNWFTKERQRSGGWGRFHAWLEGYAGDELPSISDLRETPTPAYLSFDLDYLCPEEMVTNFDQNENVKLRRVCQILDRIRPYKRLFGADILGLPDACNHPLSALTMIILARKIIGLGVVRLLYEHTRAKRLQALAFANSLRDEVRFPQLDLLDRGRPSPISEGELLEILR